MDTSNSAQPHDGEHHTDTRRRMFDRALIMGRHEAATTASEPGIFHTWAWGFLRGIESRELRCEALHGLMAALDERDAR